MGFNSPELGKKPQAHRCLLLGDSFTEALHVKRENNFATLADDLLPDIEIVNAGRSDASPVDCLEIFRRFDSKIAADRIVLIMNESDLKDLTQEKSEILDSGRIDIRPKPPSRSKRLLGPLLNRSALITHLARKANTVLSKKPAKKKLIQRDTKSKEPTSLHNHRLRLLRSILTELSGHHQVDVIFIPQLDYLPSRHAVSTPESRECWNLIEEASAGIPVQIHTTEHLLIRAYAERGQPPHGFANRKPGTGHLNNLGHLVTSRKLVEILRN